MTLRPALLALLLAISFSTTGCSLLFGAANGGAKGSNDAPRGTGDDDGPTPIVSGDAPTIPAGFEGIELGMTRDEVRAINGKAACQKGKLCGGTGQNAYPGVSWFVMFEGETDRVEFLRITLDDGPRTDFAQKLAAAWGEPSVGKDVSGHRLEAWFNDEAGIRAVYDADDGELEFASFMPFSELFGGEDEPLPAPILGKTAEEAAKALGTELRDDGIRLLPTRYGEFWTLLSLTIERGKVSSYWFSLGDDDFEEASRPVVREAVAAQYGEPERLAEKSFGCKEETLLVRKANPRISLNWDEISKRWNMHVDRSNFDPCMF